MAGLSPELPLRRDEVDGYRLNKTFRDLVQQNFKMLMLTNPGERIMDPEFGIGLRTFLFEQNTPGTYAQIESRIRAQVGAYLSYIRILNIEFKKSTGLDNLYDNLLTVRVRYFIEPLQIENDVSFELDFDLDFIPRP
mgnify:CR=1 FL=1